MKQIDKKDKERINSFIEENDLDLNIVDNTLSRYSVSAEDGITFYIYEYNGYVISKYDQFKDRQRLDPYEYFAFNTLQQVLEQLKYYDNNLPKNYVEPTLDSVEIPFDKNTYYPEWVDDFIENENWKVEIDGEYNYLVYENHDYKPELISPFNTLHEVSSINSKIYTRVDKLSFIIYPVSLGKKNEKYFFKLLCNNEEVMKEYINYKVSKKRGLKNLINEIFIQMEKFKIKLS